MFNAFQEVGDGYRIAVPFLADWIVCTEV